MTHCNLFYCHFFINNWTSPVLHCCGQCSHFLGGSIFPLLKFLWLQGQVLIREFSQGGFQSGFFFFFLPDLEILSSYRSNWTLLGCSVISKFPVGHITLKSTWAPLFMTVSSLCLALKVKYHYLSSANPSSSFKSGSSFELQCLSQHPWSQGATTVVLFKDGSIPLPMIF